MCPRRIVSLRVSFVRRKTENDVAEYKMSRRNDD